MMVLIIPVSMIKCFKSYEGVPNKPFAKLNFEIPYFKVLGILPD